MQSIGIADKVTLDLIKQDTASILENSGIQYSTLISFISNENQTVLTPILEITGSGYLFHAYYSASTDLRNGAFKVTVDGVAVYDLTLDGTSVSSTYIDGILYGLMISEISASRTSIYGAYYTGCSVASAITFPYVGVNKYAASNYCAVLPVPLRFESSLKIEKKGNVPVRAYYSLD